MSSEPISTLKMPFCRVSAMGSCTTGRDCESFYIWAFNCAVIGGTSISVYDPSTHQPHLQTNFSPTFLFSALLSLNLSLSLQFLSSPSSTSPGFIGEGESPSPCLFEVACSYIIVFPCRISSLFYCLGLSLYHHPHPTSYPFELGGWGVGEGWRKGIPVNSISFLHFTTPPIYPVDMLPHAHTDDNVKCLYRGAQLHMTQRLFGYSNVSGDVYRCVAV